MSQDLSTEFEANIPLFEAIQTLRQELQAAVNEAKDKELRFSVEKAQVELEVSITKKTDADGSVKICVFAIGGSVAQERGVTAKFTLDLKPRSGPTGGGIEVGARYSADVKLPGG
jgi:hypothetical protein